MIPIYLQYKIWCLPSQGRGWCQITMLFDRLGPIYLLCGWLNMLWYYWLPHITYDDGFVIVCNLFTCRYPKLQLYQQLPYMKQHLCKWELQASCTPITLKGIHHAKQELSCMSPTILLDSLWNLGPKLI